MREEGRTRMGSKFFCSLYFVIDVYSCCSLTLQVIRTNLEVLENSKIMLEKGRKDRNGTYVFSFYCIRVILLFCCFFVFLVAVVSQSSIRGD